MEEDRRFVVYAPPLFRMHVDDKQNRIHVLNEIYARNFNRPPRPDLVSVSVLNEDIQKLEEHLDAASLEIDRHSLNSSEDSRQALRQQQYLYTTLQGLQSYLQESVDERGGRS